MTKEEKIAEAYGEFWDIAKNFADENGWIDRFKQSYYLNIGNWGLENPPIIKNILGHSDHGGIQEYNDKWRPAKLRGIENNNGWIRIESELDLPKEDCICMLVFENGEMDIQKYYSNYKDFAQTPYKYITHYQIIEFKQPPIY